MITYEEVINCFEYNPYTGSFKKVKSSSGNAITPKEVKGKDSEGYLKTRFKNTIYHVHRLIWLYMTGEHSKKFVLHVNRIRDDNRWRNLYEGEATQKFIQYHGKIRKDNISGCKGVSWNSQQGKWKVVINLNGKGNYFGAYKDLEEATEVCNRERARLYKESGITKD